MVGRHVSLFGVAVSVGHVRKETTTKSKLMGSSMIPQSMYTADAF
jgi:hypothetical protein